jgi:release factor glutamine methyltransferase
VLIVFLLVSIASYAFSRVDHFFQLLSLSTNQSSLDPSADLAEEAQRAIQTCSHSPALPRIETMPTISSRELVCWRQQQQQQAEAYGVAPQELDWLLASIAGIDRLRLRLLHPQRDQPLELAVSLEHLTQLWQKRLQTRLPVQYLAGSTPWRQFQIRVAPGVLIPRPETELIIDLAAQAAAKHPALQQGHWADLGTGSGAIALGLASQFPQAPIEAVDCSAEALAIAQANADQAGLGDRIHFHLGEWLEPLSHLKGRFSGIVSNPPYIPTAEVATLQPEVRLHEPRLALDGGPDGLACLRRIIAAAPAYLQVGGTLLLEMMAGQGEAVRDLLTETQAFDLIEIIHDFAGRDRFALAVRRG